MRFRVSISLCVLAMAGGWRIAAAAESPRVELPGFSIVLPAGQVIEQSNLPTDGRYKLGLPDPVALAAPYDGLDRASFLPAQGRQIVVSWMGAAYSRDEWRGQLETIASTIGRGATVEREEEVEPGRRIALVGTSRFSIGVGSRNCGDRFSVMVVFSMSRDPAAQWTGARTAIDSIQCKVTQENLTRLEARVTLPRDFKRDQSADYGQVYLSATGYLAIGYTNGDVQKRGDQFRKIFAQLIASGAGMGEIKLHDLPVEPVHGRSETFFTVQIVEEAVDGFVGALYCPDHGVTFITFCSTGDTNVKVALERLRAVSCPLPAAVPSPK